MPFEFSADPEIADIVRIRLGPFADERGWFAETYRRSEFAAHGIGAEFVQDDHSRSDQRWVLRGLHLQVAPAAQAKLVRCVRGEIFDVAVDLRRGSSTYRRHVSYTLSDREPALLWIPPGFAHGFLTLSDGAEVLYKHSHEYSPEHARRIRWDDPALGIRWPLDGAEPRLSAADAAAKTLDEVATH